MSPVQPSSTAPSRSFALDALEILAPFVGDDFDLDADLREVGLDQLGHAPGVRIVGALHRHRPDLHRQIRDAFGLEQRPWRFGIVGIVLTIALL